MPGGVEQVVALAGAVTTVAGAGAVLVDWLSDRRRRRAFQEHVADDLAVVQFWEAWLRLHQAAAPDGIAPQDARTQARDAMAGLATFPPRDEALTGRAALTGVLLLHWPRRPIAWLARVPFYASAVLAAVVPMTLFGDSGDTKVEFDADTIWIIVLTLVLSAALAGLAVFLHVLARRLEEPK